MAVLYQRRFLYLVALAVALVIAGLSALRFWASELSQLAFVPSAPFAAPPPLGAGNYANTAMWHALPGKGAADPAQWLPAGMSSDLPAPASLKARVFFIHPTSYFDRSRWNAAPDDAQSQSRAAIFVRGLASPFNAASEVWAPRYRQATFGAFLSGKKAATQALDLAYGDVLAAFDTFMAADHDNLPIVLVGHSQGSLHLMRLLRERVAGRPIARRVAAAYVVGWPVSLAHDLPLMGLPACDAPDQAGCILSWQSFAEPAEPSMVMEAYGRFPGLDGKSRKGSAFLCTNPLTGRAGDEAEANSNLGTLLPEANLAGGRLSPGLVPARCGPDGFLLIGPPPQLGPFVLPGNNYHVYDIPLFWANVRIDLARRVSAWHATRHVVAPPAPARTSWWRKGQ